MSQEPALITREVTFVPDRRSLYESAVENAYANNSDVYAYLAEHASLEEIVAFLRFDACQPAFSIYLRRWLPSVPEYLRLPLEEHIEEEESEHHSDLFKVLLANLEAQVSISPVLNHEALSTLNYTFSQECASEQNHGFFAGAFFATEIMSAKRCMQLWQGLRRLGLDSVGLPAARREKAPVAGTYLGIHALGDAEHGALVLRDFIHAILRHEPALEGAIWSGLNDRLARSAHFLRWYAASYLPAASRHFEQAS